MAAVPAFPSVAWVTDADAALSADAGLARHLTDLPGTRIAVGYAVAGADDAPGLDYRLEIDGGGAHLREGLGGATVVFRTDHATAVAIHEGTMAAQEAIITGRLRIEGDATTLIPWRPALDAVQAVLDHHRAGAPAPGAGG